MSIELTVKKIISEQLDVPVENIQNHHSFIKDLGGDSLDTVEMVLTLEDEYGFVIDEDTAETLDTVQKVLDHVESLLKK